MHQLIQDNPMPAVTTAEERDETEAADYHQDMYSLEATSTYMYHKIFVDKNYSLGLKMRRLLEEGAEEIGELPREEAMLVVGGIREITEDMLKGFNCTRKELLEILCHCRKTV